MVRLEVLVDRASVECSRATARPVVTDQVFPGPESRATAAFDEGGTALLRELTVTPLAARGQRSSSLSSRRDTT